MVDEVFRCDHENPMAQQALLALSGYILSCWHSLANTRCEVVLSEYHIIRHAYENMTNQIGKSGHETIMIH